MRKLNAQSMSTFYRSLLMAVIPCFTRSDDETSDIIGRFDQYCPIDSRILVFNIELEESDGIDWYINDNHIHIAPTFIRSKKVLTEVIIGFLIYLLGQSNQRSGMADKIKQGILSGHIVTISITASGKNGYNISFNGKSNTARNFSIDYNDVNPKEKAIPLMDTVN